MHGYGKIVRGLEALAKFEKRNKSKTPIASEPAAPSLALRPLLILLLNKNYLQLKEC